jgi:NADH:ubiquinone oxidoreductase subunit 2 (subunit N)
MIAIAIIGIVYGCMVTLVQKDMKKLIAYSSVSHLVYVMLGVFALNMAGVQGGILQMVNHGISTGALFLLVGIVYERRHTRMIAEYGGLARQMPIYATYFMIMALSSMGLPLLNGFIGEFTILQGAFARSFWWAFFACFGIVLGAAYLLWLYQRVFFGETQSRQPGAPGHECPRTVDAHSACVAARCGSASPQPFFDVIAKPVDGIVAAVEEATAPGSARRSPPQRRKPPDDHPAHDWLPPPELLLTAVASLVLCLAVLVSKAREKAIAAALAGVAASAILLVVLWKDPSRSAPILGSMFVVDNFSIFFKLLVLITAALTILSSVRFVGDAPYPAGEYYGLVLFATVGTMFMASGNNLASIYVALELMALSSYVLAGYFKEQVKSTEAATKYFILGAFSSGVLLYGISLLYGFSGKMGLHDLAAAFTAMPANRILTIGVRWLQKVILGNRAPFHVWAPDVYEGARRRSRPSVRGPKAGAYAIRPHLLRGLPHFAADWKLVVAISAAATLVVGNVAALLQTNVKRLLAYRRSPTRDTPSSACSASTRAGSRRSDLPAHHTFMNFGAFAPHLLESRGYAENRSTIGRGCAPQSSARGRRR